MTLTRYRRLAPFGLILLLIVAPIAFYYDAPFRPQVVEPEEPTIESLIRIKETRYPVPDTSLFVATDGIDKADCGEEAEPCRSIRYAAIKANAGTTLVIRGGIYREYVEFNKPLTIQPFPREEVWLDGSLPVTGFVPDGSVWRRDDWRYLWTDEAGRPIGEGIEDAFIDAAHPMAGWPDMVFVNGRSIEQVGSRDEVGPGTFYVDYDTKVLYVGDDPGTNLIEASFLPLALQIYGEANGMVIRGIGFRRYANPIRNGQGAMVHVHASEMTFENDTFAHSASAAFALNLSNGSIVRGSLFIANGSIGSGNYQTDGVLYEGNYFAYNNYERFAMDWESGGTKLIAVRNATIRANIFERNWASGFWCDISCLNVDVTQNIFRENAYNGMIYEISSRATIASNLFVENGENGAIISGSNNVSIVNNTFVRNRRNIAVTDDMRENTDAGDVAEGNTWVTGNISILNNLLSDNDGTDQNMDTGSSFVVIANFSDGELALVTGASMIDVLDYNAYFRSNQSRPTDMFSLWTGAKGDPAYWHFFEDFVTFQADSPGFEAHGTALDGIGENPWFQDEIEGNYHLVDGSSLRGGGMPLDDEVVAAINGGLNEPVAAAGKPVDIGALIWADFDPMSDEWTPPAL